LISVIALTSFRGRGQAATGSFPHKFRNAQHKFSAGEVNALKPRLAIENRCRELNHGRAECENLPAHFPPRRADFGTHCAAAETPCPRIELRFPRFGGVSPDF
jgi:hypothetical protein